LTISPSGTFTEPWVLSVASAICFGEHRRLDTPQRLENLLALVGEPVLLCVPD
jgi:hypothetical protein